MRSWQTMLCSVICCTLVMASLVGAYAPNIFSYQGRLTNASGTPLNGTYTMKFSIYAAPTGGTALWTETHNSVVVTDGLFTVGLGTVDWLIWTVTEEVPRYLGVKVGADPEMTPRTELVAAPYAQRVASVNNAAGGTIYSSVTIQGGATIQGNSSIQGNNLISGYCTAASSSGQAAVAGIASNAGGQGIGLYGQSFGPYQNLGVYGYASDAQLSLATNCVGVYGRSVSNYGGTVWAGLFDGWTKVNGNFYASAKFFQIDDPQLPADRTLTHACVESDEYKNVYDGTISLDANGEAMVTLPEWFDQLNGNFRYQLTAIGAPGPNLYIAQELAANQFRIAGGAAGMKVSWQVTGVRKDAYALAHPVQVIREKPEAHRGRYLNPKEHGVGEELSVNHDVRLAAEAQAGALAVPEQDEK